MTPKLYDHCVEVYDAMDARASVHVPGTTDRVYNGYLTPLFESLGLGLSTYTPVMRRLTDMDCVAQVWRGSRSRPSAWKMLRRPTPELFNDTRPVPRSRLALLEERVDHLEAKLAAAREEIAS